VATTTPTSSSSSAAGAESEEFATEPVPPEFRVAWVRVGLISAMVAFSLPTFVTGAEIFLATDNTRALYSVLIGCGLLTLIASISGSIGARTHLSSYMLARVAFGTKGAALVNIAFAISLLGWFGVNIDLFSGATLRLLRETMEIDASPWIVELFAGAAMTVTTIYGFRAINVLSMVLVPVMMVVTALLLSNSLDARSFTDSLAASQTSVLSFGDAISSVVGGVIIGAVILPDITRFIRHWHGAVGTALLSYLLVQSIVMIAGGLAADVFESADLLDVMILLGLGWAAFAIIIAGSWVLNSLNLYSTMLSVEATSPGRTSSLSIVALGALGTIAAFLNILDHFLSFLFYLAIVFVPVAGVIAVDYFVARRSAYHENLRSAERVFSPMALVSWAGGAIVALLGAESIIRLSGIAALDAMFVSAFAYAVLSRFDSSQTPQPARAEGG